MKKKVTETVSVVICDICKTNRVRYSKDSKCRVCGKDLCDKCNFWGDRNIFTCKKHIMEKEAELGITGLFKTIYINDRYCQDIKVLLKAKREDWIVVTTTQDGETNILIWNNEEAVKADILGCIEESSDSGSYVSMVVHDGKVYSYNLEIKLVETGARMWK